MFRNMSLEKKEQILLTYQEIKDLLETFDQSDISELKFELGEQRLTLKKQTTQPQAAVNPAAINQFPQPVVTVANPTTPESQVVGQDTAQLDPNVVDIHSEMVGTFYSKPTPDEEDYVHVGMTITPETTICMIEAMKLFNEVQADMNGQIVDILVSNGQMVEYGQPLFKVRTNDR